MKAALLLMVIWNQLVSAHLKLDCFLVDYNVSWNSNSLWWRSQVLMAATFICSMWKKINDKMFWQHPSCLSNKFSKFKRCERLKIWTIWFCSSSQYSARSSKILQFWLRTVCPLKRSRPGCFVNTACRMPHGKTDTRRCKMLLWASSKRA